MDLPLPELRPFVALAEKPRDCTLFLDLQAHHLADAVHSPKNQSAGSDVNLQQLKHSVNNVHETTCYSSRV